MEKEKPEGLKNLFEKIKMEKANPKGLKNLLERIFRPIGVIFILVSCLYFVWYEKPAMKKDIQSLQQQVKLIEYKLGNSEGRK